MVGCWRAEADLPSDVRAPQTARVLLERLLLVWGQPQLIEDARLVVSELVTNAVQHAGAAGTLHLQVHSDRPDRLDVGLSDGSQLAPVVRELTHALDAGLGMHIVQQLTARWGVETTASGKRVWVELHQQTPS